MVTNFVSSTFCLNVYLRPPSSLLGELFALWLKNVAFDAQLSWSVVGCSNFSKAILKLFFLVEMQCAKKASINCRKCLKKKIQLWLLNSILYNLGFLFVPLFVWGDLKNGSEARQLLCEKGTILALPNFRTF